MRWVAISGSWRVTSPEVERDVRTCVREIMEHGDGIVTGGALNVDYFATDEALQHDPKAMRIKVFLPAPLDIYAAHYRKRATEGACTSSQAETLITQLETLKEINPEALIENKENTQVTRENYFARDSLIVDASDMVAAFHANKSPGTQDTIDKARAQGKEVIVKEYTL